MSALAGEQRPFNGNNIYTTIPCFRSQLDLKPIVSKYLSYKLFELARRHRVQLLRVAPKILQHFPLNVGAPYLKALLNNLGRIHAPKIF